MGTFTFQQLNEGDPSNRYFTQWKDRQQPIVFVTYRKTFEDTIIDTGTYDLLLKEQGAIEKIDILYCYTPDVQAVVIKHLRVDQDVRSEEDQEALIHIQDRLPIPVPLLFKAHRNRLPIMITLRNGHQFVGRLRSYGIFSLRLSLNKDKVHVILLKPNVYDFEFAKR